MLLLSKVDADLLQFDKETVSKNVVNLYLNDERNVNREKKPIDLHNSRYSNTVELSNNEYVVYHLLDDFSVISIYTLGSIELGKTINIHLPCPSMNVQHTLNVAEFDSKLTISIILQDGVYLVMELPLEFIFSQERHLNQDWFRALNPYDFTIRIPHFLYTVSRDFSVIFLNDGGLLGLRRAEETELEPVLFNDNSYLESLFHMFSRKGNNRSEKAISCLSFADKYLLVLTQSCHLKIWDLTSLQQVSDQNLSTTNHLDSTGVHENPGNYMSLLNNWLAIYLPFGNGVFLVGELLLNGNGRPNFSIKNEISTNLSSLSIWTLADVLLLKPLDFSIGPSYLNLIILWKSGLTSKVQILNLRDEDLETYEWFDASNKSLSDIEAENDLNVNGNVEKGLFNLKSRYSPQIYEQAQKILSENNILELAGEAETEDYLANLETVLRDLKNKADEVSSLTLYKDDIIMLNCLQPYNHSVYKSNSTLESVYYNMYEEICDDDLTRYLKTLHCFSTTLSPKVVQAVSHKLTDIASGEMDKTLSLKEKFSKVFNSSLQSNFELSNLKLLFDELSTFDVIPVLNNLIENHLKSQTAHASDFIDALTVDNISAVVVTESLYQTVTIQRHFVLQVLLTFALLDFDYDIFSNQLDFLLDLHFKQSLILGLYQIDRTLFALETFSQTTKFRSGICLHSYSEWHGYSNYALSRLWEDSTVANPFFMKFFEAYAIEDIKNVRGFTIDLFLQNIGWQYYIRHDEAQEFMLSMILFACGHFGQAYEYFHLHDYTKSLTASVPQFFKSLKENSDNKWSPLIHSLGAPNSPSKFEYELSLLFVHQDSPEFAYKCIKKSIDYTMKNVDIEETKEYRAKQLKVYLDLLLHFALFSEALDVLRCSHDTLSEEVRSNYYKSILQGPQSEPFFATLLNLCYSETEKGLYLPVSDFRIIDSILVSQLDENDWQSYKKLYSFRMLNMHDRSAAELVYQYMTSVASDLEARRKCYLIMINVLSTFDSHGDQWLLNDGKIVTLPELKHEVANL